MEVQISVREDKAELFLQIIREFKDDMVEKFKILDTQYVSDEEQKDIENILSSMSPEDKEIASTKIVNINIWMIKTIKITYLKKASKFLLKNSNTITESEVDDLVVLAIKKKIYNLDVTLDIKDLKHNLRGKSRIRKGKIRIVFELIDDEVVVETIVEDIDFRGNIYS